MSSPANPWQVVSSKPVTQDEWAVVSSKLAPSQPAQPEASGSQLGMAADSLARMGKQIAKNVTAPILHPLDTIISLGHLPGSLLQAQGDEYAKAKEAYDKGDKGKAALHALAYLTPVIGPLLDSFATRTASGEGPEVAGDIASMMLPLKLPKGSTVAAAAKAISPEAEAVQFGLQNGVVPRIGDAIGGAVGKVVNLFDTAAQKATFAGAKVGGDLSAERAAGMATLAERLAAKANSGQPVTLAEAGERLKSGATQAAVKSNQTANNAYSMLRSIEKADPARFSVNVQAAQDALRPILEDMQRMSKDSGGALQLVGPESRMYKALDKLVNAKSEAPPSPSKLFDASGNAIDLTSKAEPFAMPLSSADKVLGELKALQRSNPDKWGEAGNVIGQTVDALDKQVTAAARQSAPVWEALQRGRNATVKKYDALDVIDRMRDEPVGTIGSLAKQKDGGIAFLRDVQRHAPEELPNVGRALLDDMTRSIRGDQLARDTSAAAWSKLGPETKRIVFADAIKNNPTYLSDLDKFFKLNQDLKFNPNPSGSAYTGGAILHLSATSSGADLVNQALVELGGGAVTALSNPRVVRAFNRLSVAPVKSAAAQAAATTEVVAALKAAGLPAPALLTAKDKE